MASPSGYGLVHQRSRRPDGWGVSDAAWKEIGKGQQSCDGTFIKYAEGQGKGEPQRWGGAGTQLPQGHRAKCLPLRKVYSTMAGVSSHQLVGASGAAVDNWLRLPEINNSSILLVFVPVYRVAGTGTYSPICTGAGAL
ncbi:hypothetical protein [Desulfosarcina ovata]|uniref:hypothetical protein n=1 Tax=Desulfosarcina ovata TaxID=83564 RepID=UPI0012D36E33|nr:hypothetical protein [Desulfosarcina ovata]